MRVATQPASLRETASSHTALLAVTAEQSPLRYCFVRTGVGLIRAQTSISSHTVCRTQTTGMQRMGRGRLFGEAGSDRARIKLDNQLEATCRSIQL